jgi:hypothetical protein
LTVHRQQHHFWLKGEKPTIATHRGYCEGIKNAFEYDGTNALVQQRLELVLNAYRAGGFKSGCSEVLVVSQVFLIANSVGNLDLS